MVIIDFMDRRPPIKVVFLWALPVIVGPDIARLQNFVFGWFCEGCKVPKVRSYARGFPGFLLVDFGDLGYWVLASLVVGGWGRSSFLMGGLEVEKFWVNGSGEWGIGTLE
jgi:hypothetical protein